MTLFTVQSISFVFMIDANSLTLLIILPSDTPCRKYYLCICLKTPTFSFVSFRPHFYSPHLSSSFVFHSLFPTCFIFGRLHCVFNWKKTITPDWFIYWLVFLRKRAAETLELNKSQLPAVFQLLTFFIKLYRFEGIEHQFSITTLWPSFP